MEKQTGEGMGEREGKKWRDISRNRRAKLRR